MKDESTLMGNLARTKVSSRRGQASGRPVNVKTKLAEEIVRSGMTVDNVGKAAGIRERRMGKLVSGEYPPYLPEINRLAEILNVAPRDIIG